MSEETIPDVRWGPNPGRLVLAPVTVRGWVHGVRKLTPLDDKAAEPKQRPVD